jgi:hypothetical protein
LPAELQARYYLSATVCQKGHTYQGTAWCLRRKNHRGCVVCHQLWHAARRTPRTNGHAPAPGVPPLPAYLAATAYLSRERCDAWPPHRYRQSAFTLRYRDGDACVQCVTQRALQSLNGRAGQYEDSEN